MSTIPAKESFIYVVVVKTSFLTAPEFFEFEEEPEADNFVADCKKYGWTTLRTKVKREGPLPEAKKQDGSGD